MDAQALKKQLDSLDPRIHGALRDVLLAEYNRIADVREDRQIGRSDDPFEEMFAGVMERVNIRYVTGTIDFLRKNCPDLYRRINETEDRLNEIWDAGLQGKAGIEEFRSVLDEWYRLHLRGIEIFARKKSG